jgi:subtilisin-like proprotein convertase family protein
MNEKWIFLLWGLTVACGTIGAQSPLGCNQELMDYGTLVDTLEVDFGDTVTLSDCPLKSVSFAIQHDFIDELSVTLEAPNGDHYILFGDANNTLGSCGWHKENLDVRLVPGTGNAIYQQYFLDCTFDEYSLCFFGDYNVPCGVINDPVGGAELVPNCNLDMISSGWGLELNGNWILRVNDLCENEQTGILDYWSLEFDCGQVVSCAGCQPSGSAFPQELYYACVDDADLEDSMVPETVARGNPDNYAYHFLVVADTTITDVLATPDFTDFPMATYQVYGISFSENASAELLAWIGQSINQLRDTLSSPEPPFCGRLSYNATEVELQETQNPVMEIFQAVTTVYFDVDIEGSADFQWDFGDGNQSTLKSPVHIYDELGTYQIRLEIAHGCNDFILEKEITLWPVETRDQIQQQKSPFYLFPNPASNRVQLIKDESFIVPENGQLQIFQMGGQLVQKQEMISFRQGSEFSVHGLAPGLYWVQIAWEEGQWIGKLVVQ